MVPALGGWENRVSHLSFQLSSDRGEAVRPGAVRPLPVLMGPSKALQ